jgi:hypothetical protein
VLVSTSVLGTGSAVWGSAVTQWLWAVLLLGPLACDSRWCLMRLEQH